VEIEYPALLFLNAAAGMICIVLAELKHNAELALIFLFFPIMFLFWGILGEWVNITKLGQQPSTLRKDYHEIYTYAQIGLFILNIIAFLIIWFRPFFPTVGANAQELIIGILINGGIPLVVLYWDFNTPGRELARSKFKDADS
jgi:hypothetical protein